MSNTAFIYLWVYKFHQNGKVYNIGYCSNTGICDFNKRVLVNIILN